MITSLFVQLNAQLDCSSNVKTYIKICIKICSHTTELMHNDVLTNYFNNYNFSKAQQKAPWWWFVKPKHV